MPLRTGETPRKPFVVVGRVWSETISTFVRETDGYLHAGDAELIRVAGDVEEVVYKIGNG